MKAIPTLYRGILFRSRLEARWAEFFDHLDIEWQYEPEGYELEHARYLPDFWLPYVRSRGAEGGVFFEVKATSPTENERHKAKLLAIGSNRPVIVPSRSPNPPDLESLDEFVGGARGDWEDSGLVFARCDNCGQMDIGFYASDEAACPCERSSFNPFNSSLNKARSDFQEFSRWHAGEAA
jgi:hypothetical protein